MAQEERIIERTISEEVAYVVCDKCGKDIVQAELTQVVKEPRRWENGSRWAIITTGPYNIRILCERCTLDLHEWINHT